MHDSRSLTWRVSTEEGKSQCAIDGHLNEDARLEDLATEIAGPTHFDLSGVLRVNSPGVREWLLFIESIDGLGPHFFSRCSLPIVSQMNMIDNFVGTSSVSSVMAPFICDRCAEEASAEVAIVDRQPDIVGPNCANCVVPMRLNELPQRFFYFLED